MLFRFYYLKENTEDDNYDIFLDEYELDHYGTARSEEEQDTILIKDVNGIKIAFLAYTYGTNGISIPSGSNATNSSKTAESEVIS